MDLLLGYPNDPSLVAAGQEKYLVNNQGDLQFDARGRLLTVENEEKIKQNVGKIFLTEQGANDLVPLYGTTLHKIKGGSGTSIDTTYALIKQTIINALGFYIAQYFSSTNTREKIATLETLSVRVSDTDKTTIEVQILVTTEAAQNLTVTVSVG